MNLSALHPDLVRFGKRRFTSLGRFGRGAFWKSPLFAKSLLKATPNGAHAHARVQNRFVFSKPLRRAVRNFLKNDCGARPKGTSTKALARCRGDFDTRRGGCVELCYLSYRDVGTSRSIAISALSLITPKALFVAGKGRRRLKGTAPKKREGPRSSPIVWILQPGFSRRLECSSKVCLSLRLRSLLRVFEMPYPF